MEGSFSALTFLFQDMEVNPFELQKSLNDGLKKGKACCELHLLKLKDFKSLISLPVGKYRELLLSL